MEFHAWTPLFYFQRHYPNTYINNLHYEKFQDGTVKCIEDEIPFEVPDGWCWCRLPVITTDIFAGGDKPDVYEIDLTESCNIPIYSNGIENDGLYGYTNKPRVTEPSITISARGTIGFCCARETPFVPIVRLITITPSKEVNLYYLKTVFEALIETGEGSSIPQLTVPGIKPKLIPIPPVNEQVRLQNKLNQILNYIADISFEKEDLQHILQTTKSKILDLAIRGQLVPQDPNDEPASVLLERIRAEKEELIKQGKIKRDKKESVIFKGDDNSYYLRTGILEESLDAWQFDNLPETWAICCLGEVCNYGACVNIDIADIADDAWILDLEDIEKDTGTILKKATKAQRNSISTKHQFHSGQVLYSKLRPYLNKVVLSDTDGYCTSEILPLEFKKCVLPKYARYYLMSKTFLTYADRCSHGVKMPRLGTVDGKKAILSLPPLEEQKRIVETIELYFSQLKIISKALA